MVLIPQFHSGYLQTARWMDSVRFSSAWIVEHMDHQFLGDKEVIDIWAIARAILILT